MELTKNNVKVGDRLYVIPSDTRKKTLVFYCGKNRTKVHN